MSAKRLRKASSSSGLRTPLVKEDQAVRRDQRPRDERRTAGRRGIQDRKHGGRCRCGRRSMHRGRLAQTLALAALRYAPPQLGAVLTAHARPRCGCPGGREARFRGFRAPMRTRQFCAGRMADALTFVSFLTRVLRPAHESTKAAQRRQKSRLRRRCRSRGVRHANSREDLDKPRKIPARSRNSSHGSGPRADATARVQTLNFPLLAELRGKS